MLRSNHSSLSCRWRPRRATVFVERFDCFHLLERRELFHSNVIWQIFDFVQFRRFHQRSDNQGLNRTRQAFPKNEYQTRRSISSFFLFVLVWFLSVSCQSREESLKTLKIFSMATDQQWNRDDQTEKRKEMKLSQQRYIEINFHLYFSFLFIEFFSIWLCFLFFSLCIFLHFHIDQIIIDKDRFEKQEVIFNSIFFHFLL